MKTSWPDWNQSSWSWNEGTAYSSLAIKPSTGTIHCLLVPGGILTDPVQAVPYLFGALFQVLTGVFPRGAGGRSTLAGCAVAHGDQADPQGLRLWSRVYRPGRPLRFHPQRQAYHSRLLGQKVDYNQMLHMPKYWSVVTILLSLISLQYHH